MTLLQHAAIDPLLPEIFVRWFAGRGWTPREHQLELLARAGAGRSALLIAPTGGGKTLAGFLPTLVELSEPRLHLSPLAGRGRPSVARSGEGDLPYARCES
jgi:ATP-dependent Lhr-like helicase